MLRTAVTAWLAPCVLEYCAALTKLNGWLCCAAGGCVIVMNRSGAPSYFVDVLHCTPIQTGVLLAWTTPFAILGDFLAATAEAALLKRNWQLLEIRKLASIAAGIAQSAGILAFALVRSPIMAAAAYVWSFAAYGLHHSGYSANLLEVGGKDTAMLNAVTVSTQNNPPMSQLASQPASCLLPTIFRLLYAAYSTKPIALDRSPPPLPLAAARRT